MIIICASTVGAQTDIFNESWRWAHFTTESGLPSNNIYNIIETADSTLWALSDAGIAWYDGFQWINVPIAKSMLPNFLGPISDYCRDSVIYYFGGICKGGNRVSRISLSQTVPTFTMLFIFRAILSLCMSTTHYIT